MGGGQTRENQGETPKFVKSAKKQQTYAQIFQVWWPFLFLYAVYRPDLNVWAPLKCMGAIQNLWILF